MKKWTVEQIEHIFSKKFGMIVGTLFGGISILYGILLLVKGFAPSPAFLITFTLLAGIVIILVSFILAHRTR